MQVARARKSAFLLPTAGGKRGSGHLVSYPFVLRRRMRPNGLRAQEPFALSAINPSRALNGLTYSIGSLHPNIARCRSALAERPAAAVQRRHLGVARTAHDTRYELLADAAAIPARLDAEGRFHGRASSACGAAYFCGAARHASSESLTNNLKTSRISPVIA
jgi:hypothetical protein